MILPATTESKAPLDPEKPAHQRGFGVANVYGALKRDILDMTIAPGEQLDETGISERFGLSRTPVREAMVKLVAEGLATTLPNRNTIVSTIDFAGLPTYLDALTLMYRVTSRLAAERRREIDLIDLRAAQTRFAEAVADADAVGMIETNRAFHLAVSQSGGNKYYTDLFARLLNEGVRLLRLYYRTFEDKLPPEYVEEHETLIEAIAAQDAELADRLGAQHADQVVGQLRHFLSPSIGREIHLDRVYKPA